MAKLRMPKAFLLDMDDTLTRVPDAQTYRRATHAAYRQLLPETTAPMPFETFGALHGAMYDAGTCHFTGFGERFGLEPLVLFREHHAQMDFDTLVFDETSVAAVQIVADRALLFTDGARSWAERCLARLGLQLEITARDDGDSLAAIKAGGDARWHAALARLNEKTGQALTPSDVLLIDDSARVLRHARTLGFQTAQCHFGNPTRAATGAFDYEAWSVADLLTQLDNA